MSLVLRNLHVLACLTKEFFHIKPIFGFDGLIEVLEVHRVVVSLTCGRLKNLRSVSFLNKRRGNLAQLPQIFGDICGNNAGLRRKCGKGSLRSDDAFGAKFVDERKRIFNERETTGGVL